MVASSSSSEQVLVLQAGQRTVFAVRAGARLVCVEGALMLTHRPALPVDIAGLSMLAHAVALHAGEVWQAEEGGVLFVESRAGGQALHLRSVSWWRRLIATAFRHQPSKAPLAPARNRGATCDAAL